MTSLALHLGKQRILLFDGAKLFNDDVECIGEVVRNKVNPGLFGLKNLSGEAWSFTLPNGQEKTAAPGSAVPVFNETVLDIGGVSGQINGEI